MDFIQNELLSDSLILFLLILLMGSLSLPVVRHFVAVYRYRKALKESTYMNPLNRDNTRNLPCICGSGAKVKKCHGKKRVLSLREYNEVVKIGREYNKKTYGNKNGVSDQKN